MKVRSLNIRKNRDNGYFNTRTGPIIDHNSKNHHLWHQRILYPTTGIPRERHNSETANSNPGLLSYHRLTTHSGQNHALRQKLGTQQNV